jgi:hypothetical protein
MLISDLTLYARLSSAAYLTDSKDAVEALGFKFVAQLSDNPQRKCTLVTRDSLFVVCFQGTDLSSNAPNFHEFWDDVDGGTVTLPGVGKASVGFWSPLAAIWPAIQSRIPADAQVLLTGHSLGGVTAQLAKALCPSATVISYGAPRGADKSFWASTYPNNSQPIRVVHENDFAPAWAPSLKEEWIQPGPMLWLHDASLQITTERPGMGMISILSPADRAAHSIDSAYIPALAALNQTATVPQIP